MPPIIMVPGICNSGPDHWQSLWQAQLRQATRFAPTDWFHPDRDDWVAALTLAVTAAPSPPLLVAHSLGCLAVAHWAARRTARKAAGALLVAVPDPSGRAFPAEASSFVDPPLGPLPFPAMIVASENDPYASLTYAEEHAAGWGAELVVVGRRGHINSASRLGDWPEGRALLDRLAARIAA
ncbi:RBBP9/YdeN family alpha/beta hydrolase [Prosthecomicrobium pneumaticum]|uniref:Alpha/beta hydrolase n=1 Tax=Prosthecomicrobium pneumaticum TaxID=81895 RepID=A0A7W9CTI9_9HYPH|nr:alpha/beta hydrolase [Prosthecomicrobium pneumaticum]MBB5751389.1 hypothetical protein [Prosthecomicrobium pneumaticum]